MPSNNRGPEPLKQKVEYHRYFIKPHPESLTAIAEFLRVQATIFQLVIDGKGEKHEVWQLEIDEVQNLSAVRKEAGFRYAIWKVESGGLVGKLYVSHLRGEVEEVEEELQISEE